MLNRLALGHVVTLRGSSFLARGMCTAAATADIAATAATAAKSGSRKLKGKRPVVVKQRERNGLLEERAEESKLGWRIMGSTILHRYPVVTPDPFPWETEMWDLQDLTQAMRREALMDQIKNTDAQLIPDMDPTYDEILESMPFQPAPRTTEAGE
ncbi:hypothetical protein B484DRAFT_8972 [Ochromonadaceae sp. CCMP2298]|nr:hypothetical protein B484DRAFT_8972 [Ochromonadaceae sp. CCMP2298]